MGPPSRPFPVTRPRNPSQFTHALLQPTLPFRAEGSGKRANTLTSAPHGISLSTPVLSTAIITHKDPASSGMVIEKRGSKWQNE